jgi:hypothetical protein
VVLLFSIKKELLTRFLKEVVPNLEADSDIDGEFNKFIDSEKDKDIKCKAQELDLIYDKLKEAINEFSIYEYIGDDNIENIITNSIYQKKKKTALNSDIPNFKIKGALIEEIKEYIEGHLQEIPVM